MSVAVRRALYGKMAGDTTLVGMLGDPPAGVSKSIYHESAQSGAEFPYVIFSKSSAVPVYALGGRALEDELWLIKAVDRSGDADVADAISSRLDALLTDGTVSISGSAERYLRRESDVEYETEEDGVTYKHSGGYFRLIHEPS